MTTPSGPGAAQWVRVPGQTTRRYRNVQTGEVISRRQYDERFGRLRAQGFRSNEAQVAAHKSAGAPLGPARGRLKHTTLHTTTFQGGTIGDTDFFDAPRTLNGYRAKLAQLLRYGYADVRFIYWRPGQERVTSGWFALTRGNIPYILQQLLLDFHYRETDPIYHFRDIIVIGAVK